MGRTDGACLLTQLRSDGYVWPTHVQKLLRTIR